jgi:hypothetical protein
VFAHNGYIAAGEKRLYVYNVRFSDIKSFLRDSGVKILVEVLT